MRWALCRTRLRHAPEFPAKGKGSTKTFSFFFLTESRCVRGVDPGKARTRIPAKGQGSTKTFFLTESWSAPLRHSGCRTRVRHAPEFPAKGQGSTNTFFNRVLVCACVFTPFRQSPRRRNSLCTTTVESFAPFRHQTCERPAPDTLKIQTSNLLPFRHPFH